MWDDIKSVLTFAAFRPDADDPELAWLKRSEGRKSLLLNISRSQVSWRSFNRRGKLDQAGMMVISPMWPPSEVKNGVV